MIEPVKSAVNFTPSSTGVLSTYVLPSGVVKSKIVDCGVTALDATDCGLEPTAFVALTLNV